jgi:hypothetical protein
MELKKHLLDWDRHKKVAGVKPFNGIEANDKKPELTSIHSKRSNTKLKAQVTRRCFFNSIRHGLFSCSMI